MNFKLITCKPKRVSSQPKKIDAFSAVLPRRRKKIRDIIDSSPGAIRSIGSYFKIMQKKKFWNFGHKIFELKKREKERKNPVNLVIIGVISTLRPITNHDDDAIPKKKRNIHREV